MKLKAISLGIFCLLLLAPLALAKVPEITPAERGFSCPGSLAYPVERFVDDSLTPWWLRITGANATAWANHHLKMARKRAAEQFCDVPAKTIMTLREESEKHFRKAGEHAKEIANATARLKTEEEIISSLKKSMDVLRKVHERVPEETKPAIERAIAEKNRTINRFTERFERRLPEFRKKVPEEIVEKARKHVKKIEARRREAARKVKKEMEEHREKLECETAADCKGKVHPMVLGHWECVGGMCRWKSEEKRSKKRPKPSPGAGKKPSPEMSRKVS